MSNLSCEQTAIPITILFLQKLRRLAGSKLAMQKFYLQRFNLKKLNEAEGKEHYQV
jgi:hypothetical protein